MSKPLTDGIHAVLYALFHEDETLDEAAMRREIDLVIARGCAGVTVLGLATEVGKLSFDERLRLIALTGAEIAGRAVFSVTVAGNSVAEQREIARAAVKAGAQWLILQPPVVGSYGAGVYIDFMARVAEAVDLPVAIQNAPQYLGRALLPADVAALSARCQRLIAIKAEDGALGLNALRKATPHLKLLGGRGGLEMTDALRAGCTGFVLAPDIAPRAVRILELWNAGQHEDAEALYAQSLPAILFAMASLEHLIAYGKRIYGRHAGEAIFDRAPALAPDEFGLTLADRSADSLVEPPVERRIQSARTSAT